MGTSIYVVGNATDSQDTIALQIVNLIRSTFPEFSFIHWDPTEELPTKTTDNLYIIDTVIGIHKICVFHSMKDFIVSPRNSVHDFDLPIAIGLLQKLGFIKQVTLIGIPAGGNIHSLSKILIKVLRNTINEA